MAEALTIARPYAEAAFKIARDAGSFGPWSDALQRMAAIAASPIAQDLFGNPRVTTKQIAAVVADAAGQLSAEQGNFVQVLADNERLAVLPEIAQQFEVLRNKHEGVLDAHITSAFPVSDAQRDDIVKALEDKYGRKVKASVSVDPELIGGVSIRIGDEVIDSSVRGKLSQLADALKV